MEVYSLDEKKQIIRYYYQDLSVRECRDYFHDLFPERPIPAVCTIQYIIRNFEKYGCLSPIHHKKKSKNIEDEERLDQLKCNIYHFLTKHLSFSTMEGVSIKGEKNEYENGEVEDKLETTIKQEQLIPDEEQMKIEIIENEIKNFEEEKEETPIIDKELKPRFVCAYCEESFKLNSELDVHILTHNDPTLNNLKFKKKNEEVKNEIDEMEIQINGKEFVPDEDQIKTEIIKQELFDNELKNFIVEEKVKQIVDEDIESLFICAHCEKTFKLKSDLKVHIHRHTEEKLQYFAYTSLKNHIRLQSREKPHKCSYCNKSFGTASSLKIHIKSHTGEYPHKCSYCNKSFAKATYLKTHIRTHTGEKPYKCSYCSRSFADVSNLKSHIRLHTKKKSQRCSYCRKSFETSSHLNIHIQSHTGEYPHKCSFCNKSFPNGSYLKTHIRMHTGEKPHKCSYCNKSFADASNLRRHIRTHTIYNTKSTKK